MDNLSRKQIVLLTALAALTITTLVMWNLRSGPIHWAQNRWEARKARQDSIAKVEREIIARAMAGSDTVARGAKAEQDTAPGLSEAVLGPRGFYLPKGAMQAGNMETGYFPHPEYAWIYRNPPGKTKRDIWEFYHEDLQNRGWAIRDNGAIGPRIYNYEMGRQQWVKSSAEGHQKIALNLYPDRFKITRWETEYEQ